MACPVHFSKNELLFFRDFKAHLGKVGEASVNDSLQQRSILVLARVINLGFVGFCGFANSFVGCSHRLWGLSSSGSTSLLHLRALLNGLTSTARQEQYTPELGPFCHAGISTCANQPVIPLMTLYTLGGAHSTVTGSYYDLAATSALSLEHIG